VNLWGIFSPIKARNVKPLSIFVSKPGGSNMDKTKMTYFKEEDILHFAISDENESNSVELSPNITAELNEMVT
jgi:Protein of unknown function (DUF2283)